MAENRLLMIKLVKDHSLISSCVCVFEEFHSILFFWEIFLFFFVRLSEEFFLQHGFKEVMEILEVWFNLTVIKFT